MFSRPATYPQETCLVHFSSCTVIGYVNVFCKFIEYRTHADQKMNIHAKKEIGV